MPTYEYKCKKCGNTFEKFQSITDEPIKYCPLCKGEAYRIISKNGNFILKGSGFYSTDYRNNHRKPEKTHLNTTKPAEGQDKKESVTNPEPKIKKEKEEVISK